jgi:hypothetical protein
VDAEFVQFVGLIFHQGDKRGYDNGHPGKMERRELVTQGLAGTGWHDRQSVVPGHNGVNDGLLSGPESFEIEDFSQSVLERS